MLFTIISIRGNNVLLVLLHNTEDTIIIRLVLYSDVSDIQVVIWIFCHLNTANCIQYSDPNLYKIFPYSGHLNTGHKIPLNGHWFILTQLRLLFRATL